MSKVKAKVKLYVIDEMSKFLQQGVYIFRNAIAKYQKCEKSKLSMVNVYERDTFGCKIESNN